MNDDDQPYSKDLDGTTVTFLPFRQIENTLACIVGKFAFIRTSSIDSSNKAKSLYQILHIIYEKQNQNTSTSTLLSTPFRAVSWQLNMPDQEWDAIREQHYYLLAVGSESPIPHFVLPTDFLFQHQSRTERSLLLLKTIHKLEMQLNTEGWLYYSDWLNQDMEKLFKTFLPDAADEFQVEARIKDFEHEMTSTLLLKYRKRIDEIFITIGKQEFDDESTKPDLGFNDLMLLEKELIKMRGEVRANLQFQDKVLEETVFSISKIEANRAEFLPIKHSGMLLKELLTLQSDAALNTPMSWIKELFLVTLLEINLGAVSVVNCDSGLDRTGIASAFKLAVFKLAAEGSIDPLIHLAQEWDSTVDGINKLYIQKGVEGFDLWLKQGQDDHSETRKSANLLTQLRNNVLASLALFSKEIPHPKAHMHEGLRVNKDLLNILPAYIKEAGQVQPLVDYDPSTGAPEGLTAQGVKLLVQYFSFVV